MARIQLMSEQEAMEKLKIDSSKRLRRLVNSGKLKIRITQINRKTPPQYYTEDVEKTLMIHTKTFC